MGKIKRVFKHPPKYAEGQKGWFQLANFWWGRGMTPEDVHKVLEENWLEKGWTNYNHNMFQDPVNRYEFICFIGYAYDYMKKNSISTFRNACIQLCKKHDEFTVTTLQLLLVPNAVKNGKIVMAPTTFAKLAMQWRVRLEETGHLDKFARAEEFFIEAERQLKAEKTFLKLKKAKKKKKRKTKKIK